jgi:hypothetical protein
MSIESDLHSIATSLATITAQFSNSVTKVTPVSIDLGQPVAPAAPAVVAPAAPFTPPIPQLIQPPVATTPAPVVPATPAPVPTAASVPATPAPAATTGGAPFSDTKGMISYVMSKYKALGAEKGAGIQTVLASLGVVNINEVKAEQYGALFAGVEALS